MRKKFSIVKTIDTDRLDYEIKDYVYKTGETDPYIFMNAITFDKLEELHSPCSIRLPRGNYYTAEYMGYKVFINNQLEFGQIEIR